MVMIPQAKRAPALPECWLAYSSGSAWTMIARPAMSVAPPPPRVRPGTCMFTRATPSASATMLSMSPAWCAPWSMRPCGVPAGLKCPPALDASAALQSPVSCTWKPCALFGARPPTSPAMCTALAPMVITCSLPLTRLPEADARLTTALWSCGGGVGAGAGAGVVVQAARAAARPATVSGAILLRMALLLVGKRRPLCTLAGVGAALAPRPGKSSPPWRLLRSGPLAARSELAGQGVAAEAQLRRGLAAVAAGVFQRRLEQHLFHALAGLGVEVVGTGVEALARPGGERI